MPTALILPAGGTRESFAPGTRIYGVPWIARIVLSAGRGGFDPVVIAPPDRLGEIRDALNGVRTTVLAAGETPVVSADGRIAIVSTRVLPQPRLFRELAGMEIDRDRLYTDGTDAALFQTDDAAAPARLVSESGSASRACAALAGAFPAPAAGLEPARGTVVRSAADLPEAKRRLLKGLIKDTEGFLARHVSRKISLTVSRALAGTRVTPNAMTAVSVALGIAGALFFLTPTRASEITGAALFLLHSILDGCDGELARLKFLESRLGGILDFWGDNVVHAAVFTCLAIGWSRGAGETWPLWLGASAAVSSLLSAAFVYSRTMTKPREGPLFTSVSRAPSGRLSRVADELARRDFIYGVLVIALFGKVRWFLAAAAVGSPIFLVVLLVIAALDRRRALGD